MTSWQPISTAPKDGTSVILFTTTRGDKELTSYMSMIDGHPSVLETIQIGRWTDEPFGDDRWECDVIGNPTHWMKLPEPPNAKD